MKSQVSLVLSLMLLAPLAVAQEWPQFAMPDKTYCTRTTESGGSSSYVELLTCLELARDAKKLPPN